MLTSSCKSKGRRAAQELQEKLLAAQPDLTHNDIRVTPSSVTGPDLMMSEAALKKYPYAVEVKNVEKLNVWAAFEQAKSHAVGTDLKPVLFFKRNRSEMLVVLRVEDFLWLTT
jgi:hypothetical protein